ncbi:MAG TPA: hypothetical protein VFN05_04980 [Actinomycetes bacterium]|nr:hypothetical protein [Actinomycetes bacterium]
MSPGGTPAAREGPWEPAEPVPPVADEEAYSAEEEDEVAARLEALGYLD